MLICVTVRGAWRHSRPRGDGRAAAPRKPEEHSREMSASQRRCIPNPNPPPQRLTGRRTNTQKKGLVEQTVHEDEAPGITARTAK